MDNEIDFLRRLAQHTVVLNPRKKPPKRQSFGVASGFGVAVKRTDANVLLTWLYHNTKSCGISWKTITRHFYDHLGWSIPKLDNAYTRANGLIHFDRAKRNYRHINNRP